MSVHIHLGASGQSDLFFLCIAEHLERDSSVFLMISANVLSHSDYLHGCLLALIVCRNNDYKTEWIWPVVVCEHSFQQGAWYESVVKPGHSAWLGISLSAYIHHCTTRQTSLLFVSIFLFLLSAFDLFPLHLSSLTVSVFSLSCGAKRADRLVFQDLKSVSPDTRYLFIVGAKRTNTENNVKFRFIRVVLISTVVFSIHSEFLIKQF